MADTVRRAAEELFRREHPKSCPWSPWERQMELRDLWPADQEAYIRRVEQMIRLTWPAPLN